MFDGKPVMFDGKPVIFGGNQSFWGETSYPPHCLMSSWGKPVILSGIQPPLCRSGAHRFGGDDEGLLLGGPLVISGFGFLV